MQSSVQSPFIISIFFPSSHGWSCYDISKVIYVLIFIIFIFILLVEVDKSPTFPTVKLKWLGVLRLARWTSWALLELQLLRFFCMDFLFFFFIRYTRLWFIVPTTRTRRQHSTSTRRLTNVQIFIFYGFLVNSLSSKLNQIARLFFSPSTCLHFSFFNF